MKIFHHLKPISMWSKTTITWAWTKAWAASTMTITKAPIKRRTRKSASAEFCSRRLKLSSSSGASGNKNTFRHPSGSTLLNSLDWHRLRWKFGSKIIATRPSERLTTNRRRHRMSHISKERSGCRRRAQLREFTCRCWLLMESRWVTEVMDNPGTPESGGDFIDFVVV